MSMVVCAACAQTREYKAHEMCVTCYRAARREQGLDRHRQSSSEKKAIKEQCKAYTSILSTMKTLGVSDSEMGAVWLILEAYLPMMRGELPFPSTFAGEDATHENAPAFSMARQPPH